MDEVQTLDEVLGPAVVARLLPAIARRIWPSYRSAAVTVDAVAVSQIVPVSRCVTEERLDRARTLIDTLTEHGVRPFDPILYEACSRWWIALPPLVEISRGGAFLLDGTHRIYAAREWGAVDVRVLTVRAERFEPLPCTPGRWSDYEIVSEQRPLHANHHRLDLTWFRPASAVLNSLSFASRDELLRYIHEELVAPAEAVARP